MAALRSDYLEKEILIFLLWVVQTNLQTIFISNFKQFEIDAFGKHENRSHLPQTSAKGQNRLNRKILKWQLLKKFYIHRYIDTT